MLNHQKEKAKQIVKAKAQAKKHAEKNRKLFKHAEAGDLAKVKKAIADGANINGQVSTPYKKHPQFDLGETALFIAAKAGKIEVVKYLLEQNASFNIGTNEGVTPLMVAAAYGETDIVNILLTTKILGNMKVHLDTQSKAGNTALILAAREGHFEIVELLLKAGANAFLKNNLDLNAHSAAIKAVGIVKGVTLDKQSKLAELIKSLTPPENPVIRGVKMLKLLQMRNTLFKSLPKDVLTEISGWVAATEEGIFNQPTCVKIANQYLINKDATKKEAYLETLKASPEVSNSAQRRK